MRKMKSTGPQKGSARAKVDWKALDVVHPEAAGIDVGGSEHWVAISPDRDPEPVRRFGCFTADLREMAKWLIDKGVQSVAMQSTGVYFALLSAKYTPVDCMATLCTPLSISHFAISRRSAVKHPKRRTGSGSRSGLMATQCSLPPTSIPAASGWTTASAFQSTFARADPFCGPVDFIFLMILLFQPALVDSARFRFVNRNSPTGSDPRPKRPWTAEPMPGIG